MLFNFKGPPWVASGLSWQSVNFLPGQAAMLARKAENGQIRKFAELSVRPLLQA